MFNLDKDSFRNISQQARQTKLNTPFSQKIENTHLSTINNAHSSLETSSLVVIPFHAFLDTLEIYSWRSRTQYPVLRAQTTGLILSKTEPNIRLNIEHIINNQHSFPPHHHLYLQVITEAGEPLSSLGPLYFGSFAYALKEALIGFERLLALFGPFAITPEMIVVNSLGRVKVWISSHHNQNTKSQAKVSNRDNEQLSSEKIIVQQIKQIFWSYSQKNSTFRQFFAYVEGVDRFLALLKKLEEFTANKKILIAHFIKKQPQKQWKRSFSPSICLSPNKQNRSLPNSPSTNLLFNIREKIGAPVSQQKNPISQRSTKNLKIVVSEMYGKQSLSTKSELTSQNAVGEHKSNEQTTSLVNYFPRANQQACKLKKLDSLKQNLLSLFENENERKEENVLCGQNDFILFGKAFKASSEFEGNYSFCKKP